MDFHFLVAHSGVNDRSHCSATVLINVWYDVKQKTRNGRNLKANSQVSLSSGIYWGEDQYHHIKDFFKDIDLMF